jgi:Nitrous oxide-stimulated promoter
METLTKLQQKDVRVIGRFVEVFCTGKHGSVLRSEFKLPEGLGSINLCVECAGFTDYAIARRLKCPLQSENPVCKHCTIHCYSPEQRKRMQEIMAYSGRKLIMKGRLDYLWHYWF